MEGVAGRILFKLEREEEHAASRYNTRNHTLASHVIIYGDSTARGMEIAVAPFPLFEQIMDPSKIVETVYVYGGNGLAPNGK